MDEYILDDNEQVAPLVGAWIEIHYFPFAVHCLFVAPLVGAWIEISSVRAGLTGLCVAPLVGAWIEIIG